MPGSANQMAMDARAAAGQPTKAAPAPQDATAVDKDPKGPKAPQEPADKAPQDPKGPGDKKDPATERDERIENETHLGKLISERDEWKAKYRRLEEESRELQEIKAQREEDARKAEMEALESEGKYREALEKRENEWKGRYDSYVQRVQKALIPSAIKSSAAKIQGIDPDALDDLPVLLGDRVKLDPDTLEPMVVGDDGKPMLDDNLNRIGVDQLVGQFVQARPRYLLDSTARGTGARPGRSGNGKLPTTLSEMVSDRSALKEMTQEEVSSVLGSQDLAAAAKERAQGRKEGRVNPASFL